MEDVFWCGFLELHVPDQGHAVGVVGGVLVVVVGSNHQLRVLDGRGRKEELCQVADAKKTSLFLQTEALWHHLNGTFFRSCGILNTTYSFNLCNLVSASNVPLGLPASPVTTTSAHYWTSLHYLTFGLTLSFSAILASIIPVSPVSLPDHSFQSLYSGVGGDGGGGLYSEPFFGLCPYILPGWSHPLQWL